MTLALTPFVVVTMVAMATATTITIDKEYSSSRKAVDVDSVGVTVKGVGNGVSNASAVFRPAYGSNCPGLCFNIKRATYAKMTKYETQNSLTISAGNNVHTFRDTNEYMGIGCTRANSIVVSVVGNPEATDSSLAFDFELVISNNCDDESVSFKEAAAMSKGFQYGDEIADREMSNYIKGLVLGLCLALMWLCVLIGGIFCLRFCPQKRKRRYSRREPDEDDPLASIDAGYVGKV